MPDCNGHYYWDFRKVTAAGSSVYYKILDDSLSVAVVHPLATDSIDGTYWHGYSRTSGHIVIPDTVVHDSVAYVVRVIGSHAFEGCTGLSTVTIPSTIDSIGNSAFAKCYGLVTVWFNADSCRYMGDADSLVFQDDYNFATLNIGNNVKNIPNYAFERAGRLTAIHIPDSVVYIGAWSFAYDSNATELTIGRSVDSIGEYAFYHCGRLRRVVVHPENRNVGGISSGTFGGTSSLQIISLPGFSGATIIGAGAFIGCSDLICVVDSNSHYTFAGIPELWIPRRVRYVGNAAYGDCIAAKRIYYEADSCLRMGSDTMPVFLNDSNIATIIIDTNVRWIPNYAFLGCTGVDTIKSYSVEAPALGMDVFSDIPASALIYIPCGSLSSYTTRWDMFSNFIEMPPDDTVIVDVSNTSMGIATVTSMPTCENHGTSVITAMAFPSFRFVSWNDGDTANPRTITVTHDTTLTAIFDTLYVNLTVGSNDTIMGDVTGGGQYVCNSQVTIFAEATDGYRFMMWSDGDTANPRTIVVTRDTALTALFGRNQYAVTVQCDTAQGAVSGTGTYLYGYTATVTATAVYGYHFTMWSDGVTDNPRTIIVTRDTMLTALFSRNQYTVTAQCDSTQGTVAGGGTYLYEDTATVTITAAYGYHFTMWSDGVTANPRTIIVTRDTMLTAQFDRNQYTLTAQYDFTQGSVAGSGTYLYEDTATVTATAAYGYHFTIWSDGVTDNPRTIIVTRDTMLTALFDRNQYTVTAQCDSTQGIVSGAGTYLYEDTATVTATAAYGYHFTMWSDGMTDNPRAIIVTRDTMLTALFDRNQYTVTSQCDSTQGTVAGAGTYLYEDTAMVTATAAYGYHFTMWSDSVADNPRTIIVTRDTMLTAQFDRNQYTVTAQCDSTQGTVTGYGTYLYEDTAMVTATAAYGYHFTTWSDGVTNNPRAIIVTRDTMLTALFNRNQYTLTAQCDSTQGTVTGSGTYLYEDTATVTATAAYGYHFTMWSDGVTDNPRTIIVTSDTMLTALFDRNEYVLTVVCDETQGVATGAGSYLFGDVARVTVTANEGFVFSHWAETGATELAFDTVINGNVTLTALFDTLYHTLTLTSNNPEWGTVDGGGRYAHGSTATVTATAHEGFRFTGWSDGSEENPRTVVINADLELMANFAEQTGIVDAEESNVTLFPNPTHGMLHIKADNVVSVEVCTIEGRVVMRASQTNKIDMSSLPTGVYYIRVESQQGRSVHKVVKQ